MENFRNRVDLFWITFEEKEAELKQLILDRADGDTIVEEYSKVLSIAFNDPIFEIGLKDTKNNQVELIVSPNGNETDLLIISHWRDMSPASLEDKWIFTIGRQANKGGSISMFDKQVKSEDVNIQYEVNSERHLLNLKVYAPILDNLNEEQKYNFLFIYLDNSISEIYTMRYIGAIDFISEKPLEPYCNIGDFKETIDAIIEENEWPQYSSDYTTSYTGYQMKPQGEQATRMLRQDVFIGNSKSMPAINAFYSGKPDFYNTYREEGITFGFLYYDNTKVPHEKMVDTRADMEEAIMERTEYEGIAMQMGGATGEKYSYSDFIIFDLDAFTLIAKEELLKIDTDEAGYSDFIMGPETIRFK